MTNSVSRTGSASESPRRGSDVSGVGQVGVDFLGLGVPQGGAPIVLEKTGCVGLDFAQTDTNCMFFFKRQER